MFPLNKRVTPSTDEILIAINKLKLLLNKTYLYTELNKKQLAYIKQLGVYMHEGDSFTFDMDNLDYVEHLAKQKRLI